jgi:2-dehydro-3-deoxyphosphogluconate aldolase/(4S)-4-hydroxy-2-oxoglutarate aldolase
MNKQDIANAIRDQRVIGIVRTSTAEEAHAAATALLRAGLRVVEVSLVTPGALEVIKSLSGVAAAGSHIGVGTVLRPDQVAAAVRCGAEFVVSPVLDADVVAAARAEDLVVIPGAATPSEALQARRVGADMVKVFPASAWTPGVLRDVLSALPDIPFVPTGGVTLEDAPEWIGAGAVAVGLGSALTRGPADDVPARVADLLARARAAAQP